MIVEVPTDPVCPVHIGPSLLTGLRSRVEAIASDLDRILILADQRVIELHGESIEGLTDLPCHPLPSGEACKDLEQLDRTLRACADHRLSRRSVIVTLGGGATCDLGGLTASLFKRGLRVIHAPTTLLAQADASIGGKTAINRPAGKNLVGTFHPPTAILADSGVLNSLPDSEWRSGLGEVVKTALIGGNGI